MSIKINQQRFYLKTVSLACLLFIAVSASNLEAAPLSLSQQPAGSSAREPAPNVILSVDNSGSMGWDINGCQTIDWNVAVYGDRHETGATGCGPLGTISPNPSRIANLRAALITQFGNGTANSGLLPDDRIRLAWQSMWLNNGPAGSDSLTVGAANSMRRFSGAHRQNFSAFVNALTSVNGTPSHKMLAQAHSHMTAGASLNSPWALNPGTTELPYLSCRRTYNVFMTDGAWNSEAQTAQTVGNADGTVRNLPSPDASLALPTTPPSAYDPTSSQTRLYQDTFGGAKGTLADFAFRNWAEDLQPTMNNTVRPLIKQSGNEVVGATTLQEFWNPKNDPATWQHITQHTIGFGRSASTWSGLPLWDNVTDNTYRGDYANLVNGTVGWQNPMPAASENNPAPGLRQSELWHAAINGRGKFYPARSPAALTAAFSDILNNILNDTSKPLVSIAANGTRLKSGLKAYQAGYDGTTWTGRLLAYPVDSTTGAVSTIAAWNAASLLDANTFSIPNRFVASYNGATGIEWKTYSSLPAQQQTPLNKDKNGVVDNNGQNRVDFLRGDRTKEVAQTGGIFRDRGSRLGDIVNSNIVYVGKPNSGYSDTGYATFKGVARAAMVYVGANDGMLHGFDAATGVEKLAYIPQGVAQGDLRKLTDVNYTHQYFVDGTPFTGDAKVGSLAGGSTWKTVLVSGLAGGGKGYIALDASNPSNFNAVSAVDLVIADTTATTDSDIGNMYITPAIDDFIAGKSDQIVRLNAPMTGTSPNQIKHRWALVLGNGYNSTNEAPVLIVQYLDGAKEIKKISPCTQPIATTACTYKTGNGLSTPRLVDLNSDGVADVAYAGDLAGNVWKFDLSSQNDSDWTTSFSKKPMFSAKIGQSFTTAPYVTSHDVAGGVMVHISSGKNLTTADQTSTVTETTYGLWDNSIFGLVAVNPATSPATYKFKITDSTPINTATSAVMPSNMVQQSLNATTFVSNGSTYYRQTNNAVNYKGNPPKRGWFMDWIVPGQRVLKNSRSFDGQQISIYSTVPSFTAGANSVETCTPVVNTERNFLTTVNLFTGAPAKMPVYDVSSTYESTTTTVEVPQGDSLEFTTPDGKGSKYITGGGGGSGLTRKFTSYVGARANWRQKQ